MQKNKKLDKRNYTNFNNSNNNYYANPIGGNSGCNN